MIFPLPPAPDNATIPRMKPEKNKPPTVTVMMPVYNAAAYLREAVESMLSQTFQNFEIIAVNDGSTDESGRMLDDCARRDGRIRVIHQANAGCGAARNRAIALARGRYIAQQDADDVSAPTRLEKQFAFLEAHRGICAVYCRILIADENLAPIHTVLTPEDHATISEALPRGNVLSSDFMIRAETIRALGGYREAFTYSQDYDFNLRLVQAGEVCCLPEALYVVRRHPAQTSIARQRQQDNFGTLVKVFALERRKFGRDSYDDLAAAGDFQRFIENYRLRRTFYLFAGDRILRRLDVAPAREYLRRAVALRPVPDRALALLAISYVPRFILQAARSFKNRFIDKLGATEPARTNQTASAKECASRITTP